MATLAQIRTKLLNKIGDGTTINPTAAQVDDEINATITFYQDKPLWFNETKADIVLIPDDKYLPSIPTDFGQVIEPNAIVVLVSQVRYTLRHITAQQYDAIDVGGTGIPYYYTYRDGATDVLGGFQMYPYPDQDYTASLYYRRKYAALVGDSDTNAMTENAPLVIEYKALANLLRDYRSSPERADQYDGGEAAGYMGGTARSQYNAILNQGYNRTARGILTTENIINDGINDY